MSYTVKQKQNFLQYRTISEIVFILRFAIRYFSLLKLYLFCSLPGSVKKFFQDSTSQPCEIQVPFSYCSGADEKNKPQSGRQGQVYFPARQAPLLAHLPTGQTPLDKPHFNPIPKGKQDFRFLSSPNSVNFTHLHSHQPLH